MTRYGGNFVELEPGLTAGGGSPHALATADEFARQRRVEAALGDGRVICEDCGATLATYLDLCSAPLDAQCPGFVAIESVE